MVGRPGQIAKARTPAFSASAGQSISRFSPRSRKPPITFSNLHRQSILPAAHALIPDFHGSFPPGREHQNPLSIKDMGPQLRDAMVAGREDPCRRRPRSGRVEGAHRVVGAKGCETGAGLQWLDLIDVARALPLSRGAGRQPKRAAGYLTCTFHHALIGVVAEQVLLVVCRLMRWSDCDEEKTVRGLIHFAMPVAESDEDRSIYWEGVVSSAGKLRDFRSVLGELHVEKL